MRRVWILGFLVGTGCSKPTVTGQVVDALGAPVAEVSVSNRAGALCTTDNADDGTFELPCTSSDLVLVFAREGWWSVEVEVPASSADQRPIEPVRMVKKAPSLGLWRWQDGDYTTLGIPAQVRRTTGRGGNWRKHFLVREGLDAEKASVRAGTLVLFDDSADDWRLWRVADDDLVHAESAPEPNRWETDYGEQPAMHYDQIQGHRKVITLDLTPGEYFLADWTAGKFNRIKRGADRFSGRWVHVAEK